MDVVPLCDADDFDETQTFAYKGDFLGMSLSIFLRRHDDPNSSDFSLISSGNAALSKSGAYEFEDWMEQSDRLVQFAATGTRLTIVGFPLKMGVYTFLDRRLASITLTLRNQTSDTWADLLPALLLALNDQTEDLSRIGSILSSTWVRPLGKLHLVYIESLQSLSVRYVNLTTLDEFNRIRTSLTASNDL